jgi:cytochrome c biogenesis protein CcdA
MCYLEVAYVAGGMSMVTPLIVLPIIFFVVTLVSLSAYHYVQENKPKYLTLFHMVNNVARLLITLVLALVYFFIILPEHRALFTINLLIFYLVALSFTSVHFIVCERKQKKSSSN